MALHNILNLALVVVAVALPGDYFVDHTMNHLFLLQRQASEKPTSQSTGPDIANSCLGWSCDIQFQFCPPSVEGSDGEGYCCDSSSWVPGNTCAIESGIIKIKIASECTGWDCDAEGQFCPSDARGSGGLGYCCSSGQWVHGNSCAPKEKNMQYGYAHRVNDIYLIKYVLDDGGNIEVDVGFGAGQWRVTHYTDDADHNIPHRPLFKDWVEKLGQLLATGEYDTSFASLWLDIKNPNGDDCCGTTVGNVADLVEMVRNNVPSDVAIIYDVGMKDNILAQTTGYDQIRNLPLRENEGLGVWIDGSNARESDGEAMFVDGKGYPDVKEVFDKLKADQVENTVIHHGHAFNIDEATLAAINYCEFHQSSDKFRIKKVFTWTNEVQSTMEYYIDPRHGYHTDGQIVGSGTREWLPADGDLKDFDKAVDTFSVTQAKGKRNAGEFWKSSGSDC